MLQVDAPSTLKQDQPLSCIHPNTPALTEEVSHKPRHMFPTMKNNNIITLLIH
jgi:hypothetical protein